MHNGSVRVKKSSFYANIAIGLRVASKRLCFQFHGLFWDVKSYILSAPKAPWFPSHRDVGVTDV